MFFKRNKRERRVVSLLFALVLVLSISTCAWADTLPTDEELFSGCKVYLDGEVVPDPENYITLKASNIQIKEYGTYFDLSADEVSELPEGVALSKYLLDSTNGDGSELVEINFSFSDYAQVEMGHYVFEAHFRSIYFKQDGGTINNGEFVKNLADDVTITVQGWVEDNEGSIKSNSGTVDFNYGTVINNEYVDEDTCGFINLNLGTVENNYGQIYHNLGTVINNQGTIRYQYYPVYGKGLDTAPEDLLEPHDSDEDGEYILTHSDGTPYLLGMKSGEYHKNAKAYLNVNIPEGMELYLESGEAKIEKDEDGKLVISQIRGPVTLALRQIPAPAPEDPPVPAPADKTVSTPAPAVPATADNSNLPLWSGLFILFAAAVVLSRKKKA